MGRTRVKICGVTRLEDALAAVEYGADAIGLVQHAASPRCVREQVACEIVDALPAFVTPVLLFVDAPEGFAANAARAIGVSTVQFHGEEQPTDVTDAAPLRVIQALRAGGDKLRFQFELWQRLRPGNLAAILLDSPGHPGGSGVENDWNFLYNLRDEGLLDPAAVAAGKAAPVIVAGGLHPGNVAEIVRELRPWAVDVSSGVEAGVKGVKSRAKMADFIAAVREADKT